MGTLSSDKSEKRKILVVDDEDSIRYTMEIFLGEEGYEVASAESYEEALLLMSGMVYDLMFIDIVMRGKSGIELLRTIKEKDPNAQAIIITGAPTAETAAEALRLGALDYIVKPIRQHDLLKIVRLAFSHKLLSEEKERYRLNLEAIFASIQDGVVTVDERTGFVDINRAAIQLCGYGKDYLAAMPLGSGNKECSAACIDILQNVLSGKKAEAVRYIECRRRNRQNQVVSVSASPMLDTTGRFLGGVMVLRDETRLYHLEKNMKEDKAFTRMIGVGEQMRKIKNLIRALADVQTTVLITGESGTGKELAVEALHSAGDRSSRPLVRVNCGALADSILESELFGHVQGAFTGAVKDRTGRFHLANGGIIFLDEIGDISPKMQLQLLRVIETMSFEKVGSSRTEQVDVRVVAATNRDLAAKVAAGDYRADLYYRLKVVEIKLPPLRERKEDIFLLTASMIQKFNKKFKKDIKTVSSDVERLFRLYSWPGNVRELENSIEHSFILCDQNVIAVSHLPAELRHWYEHGCEPPRQYDDESEAEAIEKALEKTDGNKAKAARLLSMSRRTIYRKMNKYKIDG